MRRCEIYQAVEKVVKALDDSGIILMFDTVFGRHERQPDRSKVLPAFTHYIKVYQGFGPAERQIISVLELEQLHSTDFWTGLMTAEDIMTPDYHNVYQSVRFAKDHLPKMLGILRRESDPIGATGEEGDKPEADGLAVLSVIVIEDRQLSTPERLVLTLESIDGLYAACAQILGETDTSIAVSACDSGSDKSFDFLGLAKIVDCVKEVVLSFWDKVVYFREDKTGRRLELIAESLPILERVAKMRESNSIEPERAELIKRQVIESVSKFARAGVTIPEIEDFTHYDPRQLMRPDTKLLVAGLEAEHKPSASDTKATASLEVDDPEFQAYMTKMATDFLKGKQRELGPSSPPKGIDEEPNKAIDGD